MSSTPLARRKENASDHVGQKQIQPQQGDSFMATKKKATKKATGKKSSGRKYSPAAGKQVETEMREFKQGKLKSGRSGKTVTNLKQAIAIGLSEARKKGAKVPPPKS
jgi:Family of unknown function (DUF6496)